MRLGEIKDINYKLKGDSQMKYILIILFITPVRDKKVP